MCDDFTISTDSSSSPDAPVEGWWSASRSQAGFLVKPSEFFFVPGLRDLTAVRARIRREKKTHYVIGPLRVFAVSRLMPWNRDPAVGGNRKKFCAIIGDGTAIVDVVVWAEDLHSLFVVATESKLFMALNGVTTKPRDERFAEFTFCRRPLIVSVFDYTRVKIIQRGNALSFLAQIGATTVADEGKDLDPQWFRKPPVLEEGPHDPQLYPFGPFHQC